MLLEGLLVSRNLIVNLDREERVEGEMRKMIEKENLFLECVMGGEEGGNFRFQVFPSLRKVRELVMSRFDLDFVTIIVTIIVTLRLNSIIKFLMDLMVIMVMAMVIMIKVILLIIRTSGRARELITILKYANICQVIIIMIEIVTQIVLHVSMNSVRSRSRVGNLLNIRIRIRFTNFNANSFVVTLLIM